MDHGTERGVLVASRTQVAVTAGADKSLDLICLGRVAVDLYGEQVGGRLEDMSSFAMYLGGSSGNVAYGTAKLGLRSSMLSRVGDEHLGRFLTEELRRVGVDTQYLKTDPARLTALVFLGIRDENTLPTLFYRPDPADMGIESSDIDAEYIASASALAVTGTHLSNPRTRAACEVALKAARTGKTRTILDIDYRPVLWGLAGHSHGESRFVASTLVTRELQQNLSLFDVVVGTEEEFHIAGGNTETVAALRSVRALTPALLVLKRGAQGCVLFPQAIPEELDQGIVCPGNAVPVFNVVGAGDGFLSGFLRGYLRNEPLERCGDWGNACGALVVSRHGCAPAMPDWRELCAYLDRKESIADPGTDSELRHLHRVSNRRHSWPNVCIAAFDHRWQLEKIADENGCSHDKIVELKALIAQGAQRGAQLADVAGAGILVDDEYGHQVLADAARPRPSGQRWWIGRPIEKAPATPLEFIGGSAVASTLRSWPVDHVVKCLVFYHPDDASLREAQLHKICTLYQACLDTHHELLLEIIPPNGSKTDTTTTARSMQQIYDREVKPDWWKLPPQSDVSTWQAIAEVIEANDPVCRGIVVLGLDATETQLAQSLVVAAQVPWCKGFAVGRTIFSEAAKDWFAGTASDSELVQQVAVRYQKLVEIWRTARDVGGQDKGVQK